MDLEKKTYMTVFAKWINYNIKSSHIETGKSSFHLYHVEKKNQAKLLVAGRQGIVKGTLYAI